jgi:hypothetical protein
MQRVAKILTFLGSAILALVVGLILSGIALSGVISMQMTHVLFWLAFAVSVLAAPLTVWLTSQSWRRCSAVFVCTAVVVGGGMWWLDSWLAQEKARQDATNQPPSLVHLTGLPPSVPIAKTPSLGPSVRKPSSTRPPQDNSVHIGSGASVNQSSTGDCSPNMIGGSNTVNCGPPALRIEWTTHNVDPPAPTQEKHEFKYEQWITVKVNETYTPISLGVVCDAEIEEVEAGMPVPNMRQNLHIGIDRDNKKIGLVYFEGTPAMPDRPLFIFVWSNQPFSVLEVRQAKFNIVPQS